MLTKEELIRFVTPDENALDFLSRQASEALPTGVLCVDQHLQLRPGQVLEIAGPTGSAKSELLAQVGAAREWLVACRIGARGPPHAALRFAGGGAGRRARASGCKQGVCAAHAPFKPKASINLRRSRPTS